MTTIDMIKNTKEMNFFGFNLKPGHLFTKFPYWYDEELECDREVTLIQPKEGIIYVGLCPTDNSHRIKWVGMPTNLKPRIWAEGSPTKLTTLASIYEISDLNDALIDPHKLAPWKALAGVPEESLKIFAVTPSKKRSNFKGFVVKPQHCPGFVKNLDTGEKFPIILDCKENLALQKTFVKNPNSGNWDEVWLDLKKVKKVFFKGDLLETLK